MDTSPATTGTPPEAVPAPAGPTLTAWDRFSFSAAHAAVTWLRVLLTLRGLYYFGRLFGTFEWMINFKRRRRFAKALRFVLGRKPTASERRRYTREYFMQTRCDKICYLAIDTLGRDKATSLLTIENREILDEALARGRGVYIAYSHQGPLHVCAMLIALHGYPLIAVRDRNEGGIRRYVQDRFDRRHPDLRRVRFLFSDSFPRDIYRCYQDGMLVGSAMDVSRVRGENQKVEEVTIFGERRPFLAGPLRIALRSKAPAIQAFFFAESGFRYRMVVSGPILDPEHVEDESGAVRGAVETYASKVERYIRENPSLITKI